MSQNSVRYFIIYNFKKPEPIFIIFGIQYPDDHILDEKYNFARTESVHVQLIVDQPQMTGRSNCFLGNLLATPVQCTFYAYAILNQNVVFLLNNVFTNIALTRENSHFCYPEKLQGKVIVRFDAKLYFFFELGISAQEQNKN